MYEPLLKIRWTVFMIFITFTITWNNWSMILTFERRKKTSVKYTSCNTIKFISVWSNKFRNFINLCYFIIITPEWAHQRKCLLFITKIVCVKNAFPLFRRVNSDHGFFYSGLIISRTFETLLRIFVIYKNPNPFQIPGSTKAK